jgi:hypothetical protein
MCKLHRHVTVCVGRETAEALHAVLAHKGSMASADLRDAIRSAVAANDGIPSLAPARSSFSAAA